MKKIKSAIIHLLGGYTYEEVKEREANSFFHARISILYAIKQYADSLNGADADEWCKKVYNKLCHSIESHEKIINE